MDILSTRKDSRYISYKQSIRTVGNVQESCLQLTIHDNKISPDSKRNIVAKATLSFEELLNIAIEKQKQSERR